jgi:hypothetical protein
MSEFLKFYIFNALTIPILKSTRQQKWGWLFELCCFGEDFAVPLWSGANVYVTFFDFIEFVYIRCLIHNAHLRFWLKFCRNMYTKLTLGQWPMCHVCKNLGVTCTSKSRILRWKQPCVISSSVTDWHKLMGGGVDFFDIKHFQIKIYIHLRFDHKARLF